MSSADFLGRGWRFPILPDASGALGYSEGGEHIEHSLRLILMTTFGERAMRPDFGCEAPDLVFAPGSVQYLRLLESSVRKAVRDFEPRVELEFVDRGSGSGRAEPGHGAHRLPDPRRQFARQPGVSVLSRRR